MKSCVVTFAEGAYYGEWAKQLQKSVEGNGFVGDYHCFSDYNEINSPPHQGPGYMPYAFKPAAIAKVWEDYDLVLWCDSAIRVLKPWQRILDFFEDHDWMLMLNGETAGHWCADTALEPLGITREESFKIPNLMACVMGFKTANPKCKVFLEQYLAASKSGAFMGDWYNDKQQVSSHPDVRGHRHDQTAGAVIAHKLGMGPLVEHLLTYGIHEKDDERFLFLNNGGWKWTSA
jgi:hypothetical protein